MTKKKDQTNENDPLLPPEDGQSGVMSLGGPHADAPPDAPPEPAEPQGQRVAKEGDTVVYVPHVTNDNIGAGHCKATVTKANAGGSVDLTVHGPAGDFNVLCVDLGHDQLQRSYYWGDPDEDRGKQTSDVVGQGT